MTADGRPSPVLHVDSDRELRDDDGRLITAEPWGIYVKPDRDSVQGGAAPLTVGPDFEVDPYPTGSVDPGFPDHVVRGAVALPRSLRGRAPALPPGALGRRRRVHGRQLPRLRLHAPERLRGRRLQPRLQDDRRRARDRRGADRPALDAAAALPLRALRHRATCTRCRTAPTPGAEPVPRRSSWTDPRATSARESSSAPPPAAAARCPAALVGEARRRALQADDRHQRAAVVEDGDGERVEVGLALALARPPSRARATRRHLAPAARPGR